ncbi:hypothetical protein [Oleiharenicola lentus]|uniref:hypothetical protein n=1 Tax=Oleiharenicola lentus TaxID=2508720 RepID=UPI003F66E25E
MTSRRLFTLDEMVLSILFILCGLLVFFDQVAYIQHSGRMLLVGLLGSLFFASLARVRLRTRHHYDYQRLNGATMVAALNRPENRLMMKYMWTFAFVKNGDFLLSGLLMISLMFQVVGYLGLIFAFFGGG